MAVKEMTQSARGPTVMTISRDSDFRREARTLVGELPGVRLIGEALDSSSAAVLFVLGTPDVVLMDALLPWLEASEIVRRLRADQPETSIVVCTGSTSAGLASAPLILGLAVDDGPREELGGAISRWHGPDPPAA
jgi:DNA-binding NarL/FixJ family response regulator